jgi:hypothetical protein
MKRLVIAYLLACLAGCGAEKTEVPPKPPFRPVPALEEKIDRAHNTTAIERLRGELDQNFYELDTVQAEVYREKVAKKEAFIRSRDEERRGRMAVVGFLRQRGTTDARVKRLCEHLETSGRDWWVRYNGGYGVDLFPFPAILEAIVSDQPTVRQGVAEILHSLDLELGTERVGKEWVESLKSLLSRHEEPLPVRIAITRLLGRCDADAAVEVLKASLADPEPSIQLGAAKSLWRADHSSAPVIQRSIAVFFSMLKDADSRR